MMKSNTVNQAKELTTPFQPDSLKPETEADTVFLASADMTASCHNYGKIIIPRGPPDPSKCHVTGKGVEVAAVGEKSTAILHAVNSAEGACNIRLLNCELVSEITCTRESCTVGRKGVSQYEISYKPTIKGRHQLHIKVEDQLIRGSPFSIAVKSPVEKLGTPILTIDNLNYPSGVVINQRREVVITEDTGHCVSVFSPCGEKLRSFGRHGRGDGQFNNPVGVAVDGEGNILVADCYNHCIQKFTSDGKFLTSMGTKVNGLLQFSYPIDIAFNASINKVYVLSRGNHHVQVLNSDLTFSSTFGNKGHGERQFDTPYGISCDSTGNVYVADTNNHRIQVFTADGKFLRMFGRCGQGKGELYTPRSIAFDTSGLVYVSERGNNRVSVFTPEGQFVHSFGIKGPARHKGYPFGLAVDDTGVVYVCGYGHNCVQVF